MPIEIKMPKLGLIMAEGKVVEWRKQPGEAVLKGEVLYVLETEKVTYEVEAPQTGVMGPILVEAGQTVAVGTVVALLLLSGEEMVPVAVPAAAARAASPAAKAQEEKLRVSPLARKIADEHGIDLGQVQGTGPEGRIVKEDVLRVIEQRQRAPLAPPPPAPAPPPATAPAERIIPLTGIRRTIARRMSLSFQQAPHFWLTVEVDAGAVEEARKELSPAVEQACGEHLTMTDLLIKLTAAALLSCPEVNVTWREEGVCQFSSVHMGVALAAPGGLIVPVIRDAHLKTLSQIASSRADLVKRGREGKLLPDDLSGSTFTLSNMGMLGIDQGNAIINPPESALLFVGRVVEKPVVVAGQVVVRPRMMLTLSSDHRTIDGAIAARFLGRVKELYEHPLRLLV